MQTHTGQTPSRRKRRRFSRSQRLVLFVLALIVLIAIGLFVVFSIAESRVERVGHLNELAPGDGVYLIVGSDSRENLPEDLEGRFGDFAGARTDVILLAQVVNGTRQILSIPRDLVVDIPGHGAHRINAAYGLGGPGLLVETIAQDTGIRPNHYVEVDFGGFAGIVDAVGGIELSFPHPSRDTKSGLEVEAGTHQVDGATALAYARSRQLEELRDGSWVPQSGSDIERTARQREVFLGIVDTALSPSRVLRAPGTILDAGSSLAIDSELTFPEMALTAWSFRMASQTEARVLPVRGSGDGTVVRDEPAASEMVEAFARQDSLPAQ